ncbi:MAG: hypothetical protein AB1546_10025 [bacterium]
MKTKGEGSEETKEMVVRKVCRDCGLLHEEFVPREGGRDEWKAVGLAAAGIVLIVLIWFFVFRWGVPLVKYISNLE